MSIANAKLTELMHPVVATPVTALPSGATNSSWISMRNYNRVTFIIIGLNDGTGGVSSAVTLSQATKNDGTGSKSLAFTANDSDIDTAAADTLATNTVSSNTFNLVTTASKSYIYVIEVKAADLDVTNSFEHVQLSIAANAHTTFTVLALLRDARYPDIAANAQSGTA